LGHAGFHTLMIAIAAMNSQSSSSTDVART
jgi:hypothetical protein